MSKVEQFSKEQECMSIHIKEPVPNGHTSGGGADLDLLVVFFPGSCKHEGTQGQELLLLQLKIPPPVQQQEVP